MRYWLWSGAIALLSLIGCSAQQEPRIVDGAEVPAGSIAPGIYGNVRMSGETGDLDGIELRLDQGHTSDFVEIVHCEGWCNVVERLPVRRGMGGISFTYPSYSDTVAGHVMAVQADDTGVSLTVDWGTGLETYVLRRITHEFGLDVARYPSQ